MNDQPLRSHLKACPLSVWPCNEALHKYYCPEHGHCECQELRDAQTAEANAAAIQRVRKLHSPDVNGECTHCIDGSDMGFGTEWPCPTIRALDGEQK